MNLNDLVADIDDLIIDELGSYSTLELQDIIEGLVRNHTYTSKDSIQELIYVLENLKEEYEV